jgi:dTDP-4-amino-4,6-dideoxygalactose transaminase
MNVPFFDLSRQYQTLKTEIQDALQQVMDKTAFSGGPFVDQFEEELAAYTGVKYAVGLNSGTSALHLAMLVHGIGPGDEVIVPANTFIATAWGPSYAGATPVFCDIDPDTWNIDPESAREKINSRTKAIIGVHLYGQPCNMDALQALASEHGLLLMEDGAQSIGATYRGKKTMSIGDIAATSFYPGKNLGAYGEGGALFTNDVSVAEHAKSLRSHGSKQRYFHDEIGYNYRMEGIQAAVLSVKLRYIDRWNDRRREVANYYLDEIKNPKVRFQAKEPEASGVYHLMVLTTENRDHLRDFLAEKGIGTAFHYPHPCHLQKAYSSLGYQPGSIPRAENQAAHCLSLPMFPEITDEEAKAVVQALNAY